ncbi:amidohydrolase family protein [Sphingomonas hengshuiensis]|uniref:Amidohydrolase n=1 Tax=Sphingomonas hengshuiensis TaxID=1609977 RepID=A0A7U5BEP7_9SPHN|nr:amidohydrolase family protein [Sphingomonas hengshuiensis]AJP70884.1 amidohydrolase [Sphingomonas hengshuiensis]
MEEDIVLSDLPFIDAHVHLWELGRLRYPWLTPPFASDGPNGSVEPIAHDYGLADYRAESAPWNVVGIVHVDAGADPAHALDETDWLQGIADAEGMPNAIIAFAALDDPEVETLLAQHARRRCVRGIRHIVNWHADPRRTYSARDVTGDAAWARGFAALGRHGLSFDLQAYPGQFPGLARLIARHPETPVIVNHGGMGVDPGAAGVAEWRDGMAALAALPNVSVKLSGMGFAFHPLDAAAIRDRVLATIDLFGTDRAMLAGNFPTDRLFGDFDTTLDFLADAIADFSEDERRALFARNANRIYRLGLPV